MSADESDAPGAKTWETSKPSIWRWLIELAIWVFLAWPARYAVLGAMCAAWSLLMLTWCVLVLFIGVHTVRLFFWTPGAWRKSAVALTVPIALLMQWTIYWSTLAPVSDAKLIEDFSATRRELENQITPGEPLKIVKWHRPAAIVINHGIEKGYLYSEGEPGTVVDSLDFYWVYRFKQIPLYRRLSGNWYLFLDRD